MIQQAIAALISGKSLSQDEAAAACEEIMLGEATPSQIGGFLVALRMRGETPEEMAGMVKSMRANALRVVTDGQILDVVGTGGDGKDTFNISTAAALVSATVGMRVAKHGNRAASGNVGSADILEANGVKLDLSPEAVKQCIETVGIGFMFAQSFHPSMRFAGPTRRELGIRTIFNLLGPLTNPAGALHQVIGAATPEVGEKIAEVLQLLGTKYSWVVHGTDGLDELTTTTESLVWEVRGGRIRQFTVNPEDANLNKAKISDIQVQGAKNHNSMFRQALSNEESALRDIVLFNAAATLVVTEVAPDLRAAVQIARHATNNGEALDKLKELATLSQKLS